ncbi:GGDEF domain-containing protein [Fusibacter bizertensis]
MQGVSLGSWKLDLENLTFDETESRLKVLGIEKEDLLLPKTLDLFLQRIYVEDLPIVQDLILDLIHGRIDAYEVTYRIRTLNGGLRWFRDTCYVPKMHQENESKLAFGETLDVTDEKLIEQRLDIEGENLIEPIDVIEIRDPLTHSLNKKETINQLKMIMEQQNGEIEFLTVALIYISNFEELNRIEGRLITDHILVRTSDLIRESLKESDILGRYNFDSFLVIYKGLPNTLAEQVCKQVVKQIEDYDYGNDIPIKINYKIAEYLGESVKELISKLV